MVKVFEHFRPCAHRPSTHRSVKQCTIFRLKEQQLFLVGYGVVHKSLLRNALLRERCFRRVAFKAFWYRKCKLLSDCMALCPQAFNMFIQLLYFPAHISGKIFVRCDISIALEVFIDVAIFELSYHSICRMIGQLCHIRNIDAPFFLYGNYERFCRCVCVLGRTIGMDGPLRKYIGFSDVLPILYDLKRNKERI